MALVVKAGSDASAGARNPAKATTANDPAHGHLGFPSDDATGVRPDAAVTATFSEDMDPVAIDRDTLKLVRMEGLALIIGNITQETTTKRACFRPAAQPAGRPSPSKTERATRWPRSAPGSSR